MSRTQSSSAMIVIGAIFTGSHDPLISQLTGAVRILVVKMKATVDTPTGILQPTLTGPFMCCRSEKTTPGRTWTGRQIRGFRRHPSPGTDSTKGKSTMPAMDLAATA